MNTIQSVCVYSASSTKIADCYFRAARELGELLAHHGIRLVNGAGNLGLMRACADACLEAGCSRVLLACTELSVIKNDEKLSDWYIDPMEILTKRVIEFSGKKYQ